MKRVLDILLTIIAAPVALPLALIVTLAIYVRMGRPVLFSQLRCGRNGHPFTLYKFRTMVHDKPTVWDPSHDRARLTPLGKALRRWSLDEIPQLWNVIKGDMSWVGPRPLPVQYLPRYSERQSKRHGVLPGITGWAQINGRNTTRWPERLELDVWYVENRSMRLDVGILWRTVKRVLSGEGVSASDAATMTEFQGEH